MPLEALHRAVRIPMTVATPRAPPAPEVTCLSWVPMILAVSGDSIVGQLVDLVLDGRRVGDQPVDGDAGDDRREQGQQAVEGHPGPEQRHLVLLDLLGGPLGDVLPALGRDLLGGVGLAAVAAVGHGLRVGLVAGPRPPAGGRAQPAGGLGAAAPAAALPGLGFAAAGGLAPHQHGPGEHADPQRRPGHPPGQPWSLPLLRARRLGHRPSLRSVVNSCETLTPPPGEELRDRCRHALPCPHGAVLTHRQLGVHPT